MFTIELTPEALAKIEKEGIGPVFGFSKGGFVDTEKDPLHRLGFTGGGGIAIEDPLARLGFTGGGGLMVSIGVAPISEKQISKLEKVLKKRKAKREGGSIKRKLQYREAKRNGGEISRQQYKFGDRVQDIMSRIFIGASTEDMKKLQSDTMKFIDDAVDRGEIEEHERTIYKDEKTGKKYKNPRTGEAYNSILHGRLAVRFGDAKPQSRVGLQSKEFLQARNIMKGGIYDTSKGKKDNWWTEPSDALNNRAAFNILDKNPSITNEEADKQLISLYQTSREKTSRGEPLIIGEDFFLTKEDFINAGEPSVFGN